MRDGAALGGEEREVGALFVDLVGSTAMAMEQPPADVVRVLNRFFQVVVGVTEREVPEVDFGIGVSAGESGAWNGDEPVVLDGRSEPTLLATPSAAGRRSPPAAATPRRAT